MATTGYTSVYAPRPLLIQWAELQHELLTSLTKVTIKQIKVHNCSDIANLCIYECELLIGLCMQLTINELSRSQISDGIVIL